MALFLTSLGFAGLGPWLRIQGTAGPIVLVDNAGRALADGETIVGDALAELTAEGMSAQRLDVTTGAEALDTAGAVVLTGGDPFRLLADLRASGADRRLADAFARGVPIAGQSAGALVCGPSLAPMTLTSPFEAPPGLDPTALGLTGTVVLPHHDRQDRAAAHRRAAIAFRDTLDLTILNDDEALILETDAWWLRRGDQRTRPVRPEDAEAVAEVFHAAVREAWAPFLGSDRVADAGHDLEAWGHRVARGGHRFLVCEDDAGLTGFVYYRHGAGNDGTTGEVDLLYTHPRVWGMGTGRRLLERATWNLLCEGYRDAVLWTEARNDRALALYRRGGWVPDGVVEEREYLGVPIRNVRHRLDLTRYAGGD